MSKAAKIKYFLEGVSKALKQNEELKALCNGVFDWVPEKVEMPFVTFGKIIVNDDDTKLIPGNRIDLDILVWDTGRSRMRSLNMIEQIELSLSDDNLDSLFPPEISLVTWDIETIENEEQQYGLYCSVVKMIARVE